MEAEVHVRCRKSDYALCKEVCDQAAEEYKRLMKKEVNYFHNREVPITLILDDNRWLPEFDDKEGAVDSCMGGLVLHAKKGRIVCSNTLDSRLQLVYQEAIPEIRANLFTSIVKNTPHEHNLKNGVAEEKKPHH